jgi:hypothetical protein
MENFNVSIGPLKLSGNMISYSSSISACRINEAKYGRFEREGLIMVLTEYSGSNMGVYIKANHYEIGFKVVPEYLLPPTEELVNLVHERCKTSTFNIRSYNEQNIKGTISIGEKTYEMHSAIMRSKIRKYLLFGIEPSDKYLV